MILEKLVDMMIDEVLELIKNGYKKMDQYNDFSDVYDDVMKKYQEKHGSDAFYELFFVEAWEVRDAIKERLDQDILTRELSNEIMTDITEMLGEEQTKKIEEQIHMFIATLISRLLYIDSYRKKIRNYRQDANISDIRDNTNAMLNILSPAILDRCKNSCKECAEIYTEKLFLEGNDPRGKTLKDMYVSPLCQNLNPLSYEPEDIYDVISQFIKNDEQILLITANAGMGKSSLMSKLTYDYLQSGDLYGLKKVFFVKLGELSANTSTPLESVSSKLKIDDLQHFNDSLLLLDAYDELQDVGGDVHQFFDALVKRSSKYRCKIIVTSRLNYIDLSRIQTKATTVQLLSLDEDLRKKWLDKYDKEIVSYDYLIAILSKEDNDLLGIPIVLYFIAYGDLDVSLCKNKYALYKKLFGLETIRERTYGYDTHKALYQNAENLYQLMLDISLRIFQRNTDLIIDKRTVSELLHNYSEHEKDTLLKYCGIASYFNSKGDGVFEYVHKSIYEFYLSVKIYTTLKQIFQAYHNDNENIINYITDISHLLLYTELTEQTLEFIYEQIAADTSELSLIVTDISELMYKFLSLGPKTMYIKTPSFLTQIKNTFLNIWKIYNKLILLTSKKQVLEDWFKNKDKNLLLFEFLALTRYNGLCLTSLDLSKADLSKANLSGANLTRAILHGADLHATILHGAGLHGADLSGTILINADLSGADLTRANLSGTILSETNLTKANLSETNLTKANLSGTNLTSVNLSGADLSGANLSETNLSGTNLSGANLSGANLNGANLSGASLSGASLTSVNLGGTNLTSVNLSGADLSGADLSEANLSRANLYRTILHETILHRAVLIDTVLSATDLRRADLRGAYLIPKNMSYIVLSTNTIDTKTKITLAQLCYLVDRELSLSNFKIYNDTDTDRLANPEDIPKDIMDIIERTK